MLKAVGDFVQLEVDRPYHAGEPIVVWCGPQPNSRLLLNYGFVDEDNPYDRLSVEASLETDDPLYQQKRIIVQRNNRLTVQTFQVLLPAFETTSLASRHCCLSFLPFLLNFKF
jgi:hypothetical protein